MCWANPLWQPMSRCSVRGASWWAHCIRGLPWVKRRRAKETGDSADEETGALHPARVPGEESMPPTTLIASPQTASSLMEDLAGKYLIFRLGREEFGTRVIKVREIMGIQDVTPVPHTPVFVTGVINLRGKVIPVIDLRLKFGLPAQEDTTRTRIVVVRT